MLVGIISIAAVVLALGCLSMIIGRLLRRIRDLDTQLVTAREQVAALNEVLAQAPSKVT